MRRFGLGTLMALVLFIILQLSLMDNAVVNAMAAVSASGTDVQQLKLQRVPGNSLIGYEMTTNGEYSATGNVFGTALVSSSPSSTIRYVAKTGDDVFNDCTNSVYPCQTIQHGIDEANVGDTVLVELGTYVENINFNGKNITVESTDGPDSTIIDGNQNGSVVTFENGETSSAVLNGFTLLNGNGTELTIWTYSHHYGGGIYSNGSSPTLENIVVSNNSVDGGGGGIFLYGLAQL